MAAIPKSVPAKFRNKTVEWHDERYLPAKGGENRKHFVADYLTLAKMTWDILK